MRPSGGWRCLRGISVWCAFRVHERLGVQGSGRANKVVRTLLTSEILGIQGNGGPCMPLERRWAKSCGTTPLRRDKNCAGGVKSVGNSIDGGGVGRSTFHRGTLSEGGSCARGGGGLYPRDGRVVMEVNEDGGRGNTSEKNSVGGAQNRSTGRLIEKKKTTQPRENGDDVKQNMLVASLNDKETTKKRLQPGWGNGRGQRLIGTNNSWGHVSKNRV